MTPCRISGTTTCHREYSFHTLDRVVTLAQGDPNRRRVSHCPLNYLLRSQLPLIWLNPEKRRPVLSNHICANIPTVLPPTLQSATRPIVTRPKRSANRAGDGDGLQSRSHGGDRKALAITSGISREGAEFVQFPACERRFQNAHAPESNQPVHSSRP